MSTFRLSLLLGTALLITSCVDDMPRADIYDDGSISFSVDHALLSRGGGANPTLSFHKSIKLTDGEKPLYLLVESSENPATSNLFDNTRALPVSLDDLEKFYVTATINGSTDNKFIDNVTVTKNNDNTWHTASTYYWPQNDALTFFCTPQTPALPDNVAESLERTADSFKFDYSVPVSDDGLTDADAQDDFIMAIHTYSRADVNNGVAPIKFKHPLAGICFVEDESLDDENLKIAKIELSGLYGEGSCEFNGSETNLIASDWTITDNAPRTYCQTANDVSAVDVPVSPSTYVNAVAAPFMVIPHKKDQMTGFKVKVTLADGATHEADLSSIDGLEPGRMYVIRLSGLDAKYPPVENLQGMAGYGTVSLNWENPESTYSHIHQCGVTVRITQKNSSNSSATSVLYATFHWNDTHSGALYPDTNNPNENFDLFADIKTGVDKDGNTVAINTRLYDEFECDVYADYYNTEDEGFNSDPSANTAEIHQSIARTITIKPGISDDKVLFYIPEGAKTPDGLLDDDDVAAWDWFKKTYPKGDYVTHATLAEKVKEGFNVVWVPCGVNLRGSGDGNGFADYLDGYDENEANSRMNNVNSVLSSPPDALTKASATHYKDYEDNYSEKLMNGSRVTGCYNDPRTGTIMRVKNVKDYFTQNDIEAIRRFYGEGGNLLLTTFSIELVYELGVIPFDWYRTQKHEMRPYYHLFNEVKPSSTWFVRADFENHNSNSHPLYKDMFKGTPSLLNIKVEGYGVNEENPYIACGTAYDVEMFPLLSLGADACENNNVVWNFGDGQGDLSLENMEEYANCKFLGTWGQISNQSIGVVVEFYPGSTTTRNMRDDCYEALDQDEKDMGKDWIWKAFSNHGRCLAIGLGAYEFNNGMKYTPNDADFEVKNYYQSNVHKMTQNAINYLMTAPTDKK